MGKRICRCICPCFSAPDEVEAVRTDPSGAQEASSANNSNSVVADSGKGGSSSETGGPSAHHDHDSANSNNKRGGEGCSSSVSQEAPSAHAHVTDGHGGEDSANNSNSVVGDSAEGGSSSETGGPSAHHDHDSANSDNKRGGEGCSSSGSAHAHAHGGQDSSSSSNVNLDDLINHISQLLHQIKEKSPPQRQQTPHYIWPTSSPGFLKLQEFLSRGIDFASAVKDVIPSQHSTEAKAVVLSLLKGIARAHVVTAGLLVVANILERFEAVSDNRAECLSLLDEMNRLAKHVKQLKERRGLRQGMENIIEEAVELIVEASLMCCTQIDSSTFSRFFTTSVNKGELVDFQQKLQKMYNHMKNQVDICIFDAIDAIACRNGRPRKPRERGYPEYAVGIEEPTQEVIKLLEWESEKNAWGVVLYGFGGIGKTTVGDAVFARLYIEECKYSMVSLFESITSTPNIVELQKCILKDLMVGTAAEEKEKQLLESIVTFRDGQREIQGLLEKEMAFIYIDNVLEIEPLEKLLPRDMTKAKKLRILMTARDIEVRTACKFKTKAYDIKGLPDVEAESLLKKEMYSDGGTDVTGEQMSPRQLREIAQICGGIPRLLSLVAGFIRCEDDKQRAVGIIMEEKEKWKGRIGKYIEHYVFAYENLPMLLKDPFLDICKFFNGWQWDEVADILGESNLDMLQKRALVTRDTNMTTQVHDVILKVAEESDKGMRLTLTNASQIQDILYQMEQKDLQGMKGLWLREIKIEDPLQISASKLDFMHRSLRILSLGDITVEGKCDKKFENLVFFQSGLGSIDLPFDVSKSEELTYLAYHQPEELNVYKMPEDLKKDAIDRMRRSQVLQISSRCLRPLRNLRILRLIGLTQLEKLPADLGDLNGLHELTLSRVPCIEELPPTISKLQSLRVLRLDRCSCFRKLPEELGGGLVNSLHKLILSGCNLIEELPISISKLQFLKNIEMDSCTKLSRLPDDFGSLKSLQELNLSQCNRLVAFPSSFKNLSSLRSLNISGCESLQYLLPDLGSLTSLVELNLSFCKNLITIPDSIGQLKLLAFSMDIRYCQSLTQLPDQFCQLSFIRHLELDRCYRLKKLPDAFGKLESLGVLSLCSCGLKNLPEGFGQLKSLVELNLSDCHCLEELSVDFHRLSSLRILNMEFCTGLKKLPEDFHCLESLEVLSLYGCYGLQRLPEGFGQLGSLRVLSLRWCISLEKLPEGFGQLNSLVELNLGLCDSLKDLCIDFHCLNSLEYLILDKCNELQGKWMDDVVKLKALGNLDVRESPMLVQRLTEIQRECHQSWRFIVETGQGLFEESNSKNREDALSKLSSKLDTLLTDEVGETFNVSALRLNTVVLVMFDGDRKSGDASAVVEYAIKHRPINFETIYIGRHFNSWPRKIAHRISAHAACSSEALLVVEKITSTSSLVVALSPSWRESYFQMSAKIVEDGKGGKYLSCWEYLGKGIPKEFVLSNCEGYLQLKQVEETPQSSNINMLRELFACGEKEETMATDIFLKDYGAHKVGVDKLQGKIILLHLGPLKEIDILRDVLTEGYVTEKERCNLEIISIVKGSRITEVERFAKEVPWLVYQYPRTITKAKRYFLYEKCSWKWKSRESGWVIQGSEHSTGIMVIERNGRIPSYKGLPLRMIVDRWGWKAYPFTEEKIEELKEEEWNDLPHFSPLMFLVKHLGEVKERMLSPKMIFLCGGVEDESEMTEFTSFLRDEFKGQWDSIHLIYVPRVEFGEVSEVAMRDAEMEGMTLLTLSKHDAIRFWERVLYLREEIEGMDEQRKGVGTMKTLLKFCGYNGDWATLMGKDGELISYMGRNHCMDGNPRMMKRPEKEFP